MNKKIYKNIREAKERVYDSKLSPFQVSTSLPAGRNNPVDPHTQHGENKTTVSMAAPYSDSKLADLAASFKNPAYSMPPKLQSIKDPKEYLDKLSAHLKVNVDHQMDSIIPEVGERTRQWYPGAHKIAGHFAKMFNVPHHVATAVIATQSPQKDWNENVSLAERIMKIHTHHQNTGWSPEMEEVSSTRVDPKPIFNKEDKTHREILGAIRGKSLGELQSPLHKAGWIRAFDEAHHPRHHRTITPEGEFGEHVLKADNTRAGTGWNPYSMIANGVRAIESKGDMDKISRSLGEEHKVRSFYNNIQQPNAPVGKGAMHSDVTGDTHNVRVVQADDSISGTSHQTDHNLGGAPSDVLTGQKGSYAVNSKVIADVARERGYVANAAQSDSWEKMREEKTRGQRKAIADLHSRMRSGNMTQRELLAARDTVIGPPKVPASLTTKTNAGIVSTFESVVNRTFNTLLEKIHQNKLLKKLAMKYNTSPVARPQFVGRIPTDRQDATGKELPTLLTYKTASNLPRSDSKTEIATDDIDLGTRERVKNQAIKNWEDRTQASSEAGKRRERFIDKATSSGSDDILRRANTLAFQKRKAHNSDINKFGARPEPHFTGNALGNIVDVMIRSVQNRTNQSQPANKNLPAVGSGHY